MDRNTIKVRNIDNLIGFLKEETSKQRRFPAIFILTKNLLSLRDILKFLDIHTIRINIGDYCQDQDLAPLFPFEEIRNKIKSGDPLSITSLCAWWRLGLGNPAPDELIKKLACLEDPKASRLLIPLYDPFKDIQKIWLHHFRTKHDEFSLFIEIDGPYSFVETYIAEPLEGFSSSSFLIIKGIKEYLSFFSNPKEVQKVLMFTKAAKAIQTKHLIKPLKSFSDLLLLLYPYLKIKPFKDEFFLKEILLSLNLDEDKSFNSFVERVIGYPLKEENIIKNWKAHNIFQQKLLIFWANNQEKNNKFVSLLASSMPDELTKKIYFSDLDLKTRKKYLSYLAPYQVFNLPNSLYERLKLLTDLTSAEEKELLKCLNECLNELDTNSILKVIEVNAPFLFYYLNPKTKIDDNDYFYLYRLAKLGKQIKRLPGINFQSFLTRNEVLSRIQHSLNEEIWIDGLGIEWIGIFDNYFRSKNGK